MSFTQQAYSNPQTMLSQLKAYFTSLGKNNGWSPSFKDDVVDIVQDAYDDNYSIFSYDTTIVQDMVKQVLVQFEQASIQEGNGNPMNVPKFEKVMNVLASLSDTAFSVDQYTGISGVTTVVQDQVEEESKKLEQTRNETFSRLVPWVGFGLVAYFVIPKLAETYLENK
jgi:hypothetical protein